MACNYLTVHAENVENYFYASKHMAMNYEQTGRNDLHCLFNSAGTKSDSIKHDK